MTAPPHSPSLGEPVPETRAALVLNRPTLPETVTERQSTDPKQPCDHGVGVRAQQAMGEQLGHRPGGRGGDTAGQTGSWTGPHSSHQGDSQVKHGD